jgi:hypothetical protein
MLLPIFKKISETLLDKFKISMDATTMYTGNHLLENGGSSENDEGKHNYISIQLSTFISLTQ